MYTGLVEQIDFGIGGLHTDDPHTQIPMTDLVRAMNVSYEGNVLQKAPGSHRFNTSALSSGIVGAVDWWPNDITQRTIAVTSDGLVYRMVDKDTQAVVTTSVSAQTNLQVTNQVSLVTGGAESATANRKVFIFTGSNPVQVISGDATTRYNMTLPAVDWSGVNQPSSGVLHHGRLWAWGNFNNPHTLYASDPTNQENFQSANLVFTVYPGEFEKILACYVFKGRMFIFKYPFGVYYLDDSDSNTNNWAIRKFMDNFGAASAHSGITVLNDMLIANSFGSITSANAVQYYGGFDLADVLVNTRTAKYVRENISPQGNIDRHAIYYEYKKQAFFAYRSSSGIQNDRILYIDYSSQNPKVAWWDKDQANCLFLRKDIKGVPRPAYGSNDGYIYLMDQVDRDVAGFGYQMDVMTPFMDFKSPQAPLLSDINKIFDFLELVIEASGKWDLSADVFIDGKFSETLKFEMSKLKGTNEFVTNVDRTYDGAPITVKKTMHGFGKRVALRFYNSTAYENIKLLRANIYYRPGTQAEKDAS